MGSLLNIFRWLMKKMRKNSDYLVKTLAFNGELRVYAATTTKLVSVANENINAYPTAIAALGRVLTVTVMMGGMLKGRETVTVRINGNGPLGLVIADANAHGQVRGYVTNPRVHLQFDSGKLNVGMAVGTQGDLYVTKDLGLKDYFTGQVPLQTGEIGDDFTYYFTKSEQIPAAVGVGVGVSEDQEILAAGGFIIQVMPGASEATISRVEQALAEVGAVSELIAANLTPEELVAKLVGEANFKVLETMPLAFECNCSHEKFATGLASLGNAELDEMIHKDNGAETICHFCMKSYQFTATELLQLKSEACENAE